MSIECVGTGRPHALVLSDDDVIASMGEGAVGVYDALDLLCASKHAMPRFEIGAENGGKVTSIAFSPAGLGPWGSCLLGVGTSAGGSVWAQGGDDGGGTATWRKHNDLFVADPEGKRIPACPSSFGCPPSPCPTLLAWSGPAPDASAILAAAAPHHGVGFWTLAPSSQHAVYVGCLLPDEATGTVTAIAWHTGSQPALLAAGTAEGETHVWSVAHAPFASAVMATVGPRDGRRVDGVAWMCLHLAVCAGGRLTVWRAPTGDVGGCVHVLAPHDAALTGAAWLPAPSPDAEPSLLTTGSDGVCCRWSPSALFLAAAGAPDAPLLPDHTIARNVVYSHPRPIYGVCVTHGGLYACIVCADTTGYQLSVWRTSISVFPLVAPERESVTRIACGLADSVLTGGVAALPLDLCRLLSADAFAASGKQEGVYGPPALEALTSRLTLAVEAPAPVQLLCCVRALTAPACLAPPFAPSDCVGRATSLSLSLPHEAVHAAVTAFYAQLASSVPAGHVYTPQQARVLQRWARAGGVFADSALAHGRISVSVHAAVRGLLAVVAFLPPSADSPPCPLCDCADMEWPEPLLGRCGRGHILSRCALSLVPLQDSARVCRACGAGVDPDVDAGLASRTLFPWLTHAHLCVVCGGRRF